MDDIESRLESIHQKAIVLILPRARTIDGSIIGCVQKIDTYKSPVRASRAVYLYNPSYLFNRGQVGPEGEVSLPCPERIKTDLVCASRAQYAPVILPFDSIGDVYIGVEDIGNALTRDPFFGFLAPYILGFKTKT